MTALFWTALVGCEAISDLKETVDGLTNPLVAEAMFLGIAEPSDPSLDLGEFSAGAGIQTFLADAADPTKLEDAPIKGATVRLRQGNDNGIQLRGEGDGLYTTSSEDDADLEYQPGQTVTLSVDYGDDTHKVSVRAPSNADVDVPEEHSAQDALALSAVGQDFDAILVAVVEADSGEIVFSNEPTDINDLYDFSHGQAQLALEVPASAFQENMIYAVGVAGMRASSQDEFDNMNSAVSSFMAGRMQFHPLSTIQLPD